MRRQKRISLTRLLGPSIERCTRGWRPGPDSTALALAQVVCRVRENDGRALARLGGEHIHFRPAYAGPRHALILVGVIAATVAFAGTPPVWANPPLLQQGPKLTGGSEEIGGGSFGYSVALSAEGSTALVGSPAENGNVGGVWVFTRSGASWSKQGPKLTGTEEIGRGSFGLSLALSSDGSTALIGGDNDNTSEPAEDRLGAAWVFTRSGTTWTQQGPKLTGNGAVPSCCGGGFGVSVALSADGNTALVGDADDDGNLGAAWVFTRSGTTWTEQAEFTGSEMVGGASYFGDRVALSSDGNTALIGGDTDNDDLGAAWVFTRSGTKWTQQGPKLTGAGESGNGFFGSGVALSAEGNTALITGYGQNEGIGAAWTFTRSGTSWGEVGEDLTATEANPRRDFGFSVALSSTAETALVGGPYTDDDAGGGWLFARAGSTWTQEGERLIGKETCGIELAGWSVALSAAGNTALIGAPEDCGEKGAVWVFAPRCSSLQIETESLPAATRGVRYEAKLEGCGGTSPYRWKKSGLLPRGLRLSKFGVLSGTPSSKLTPGSYPVGVKVVDSEKPKHSASAILTLQVN